MGKYIKFFLYSVIIITGFFLVGCTSSGSGGSIYYDTYYDSSSDWGRADIDDHDDHYHSGNGKNPPSMGRPSIRPSRPKPGNRPSISRR
jgi:hypothetical protein